MYIIHFEEAETIHHSAGRSTDAEYSMQYYKLEQ